MGNNNIATLLAMQKGSGASVTPASVLSAMEDMDSSQQSDAREAIGAGEPVTDEQLADAAAAWLEDNITNPSSPPLDKSLSVSNAAADSATVGGILYGNADPTTFNIDSWILSSGITETGTFYQNNTAINSATSSAYYNVYPGTTFYRAAPWTDGNNNPAHIYVHEYAADGTWLRRTAMWSGVPNVIVGADCAKVRFVFFITATPKITLTKAMIDAYLNLSATLGYGKENGGFSGRIEMLEAQAALGLHTVPATKGVANLIKRCRQLTDIEWTPAVDMPRFMLTSITPPASAGYAWNTEQYIGVFKAGTKYRGVPYGGIPESVAAYGYTNSFVGLDVDFSTFVTAMACANSIAGKESEESISGHKGVPYCAVCSALTSYALNVPYVNTANIPSISGLTAIGAIVDNGVRLNSARIKLGDVLNKTNYHTAVITDIIEDSNGNVTAVEISEATVAGEANPDIKGGPVGGLCRRYALPIDGFYNSWGDYTLYRYSGIDSIPYTPNPYVQVGDEPHYLRYVDWPILPYMGNNFAYKAGHIVSTKILVNSTKYGFMRVFKDGSEITGSPFTVAEGAEYVEVGFSAAGSYEAYLCNMSGGSNTEVTAKCRWSVES